MSKGRVSLREEWGKAGCRVLVAEAYRQNWIVQTCDCLPNTHIKSIFDNPHYVPAKKQGDVAAAIEICRVALDKAYRTRVKLLLADFKLKGYGDPIFVAPCKPTSQNALAKTAASFLGKKLGIDVDTHIQEIPCPSRKDMERRDKFFQRPEFTGKVQKGRLYIMVDDMVTTGGTLAELRSYIVSQGGHVAFACSLASADGMDTQLHPKQETLDRVERMFKTLGQAVRDCIQNKAGLTPAALTQAEAEFFGSESGRHALKTMAQNLT